MTLVIRHHDAGGTRSSAVYSACGRYRYDLTRIWDDTAPGLLWVMLNPSTASESANDPTIERCERRTRRLGYGAMRICNLFAYRETRPRDLLRRRRPVGEENDRILDLAAGWAADILCAWGVHGSHRGRDRAVTERLAAARKPLYVLGLTRDGYPRHPLYLSYAAPLMAWSAAPAQPAPSIATSRIL